MEHKHSDISFDRGYNGNIHLKRANVQINWTLELFEEYIKCKNDPIYFAENYIKIVHVDRGLIPIELYDYQRDVILASQNNRYVAVNQSRQSGKTTAAVAIILHYVLFNEHKTVGLLANKGDAAREILSRIQIAYEALPNWLSQGVVVWNKGSIELENGCKIIAAATSSSAVRGKSLSFLYIDETAFVENWDEFFASVFPTISSGVSTKLLLTSTPKGLNHFYKICKEAQDGAIANSLLPGKNGYVYIEVPWYRVPGRDEKWKQETLAAMSFDTQKFETEFNCQFQGSSGTLISGSKLKELTHQTPLVSDLGLSIYQRPILDHTYVSIVDVSRGKGLDYSAFQIIDVTTMPYNLVASFRSNILSASDYAEVLFRTITQYNNALTLIEINDLGEQVSSILIEEFEYESMLYTESAGRSGKRISGGYGQNVDKGIRTTKSVKSVGCSMIKMLIEQNQLIIQDFSTINELSTFSKKAMSFEAEPGCHDDMVMCLVLFGWLTTQPFFKEITDINTIMRLREKTQHDLEDSMLLFGFNSSDEVISEIENNDIAKKYSFDISGYDFDTGSWNT